VPTLQFAAASEFRHAPVGVKDVAEPVADEVQAQQRDRQKGTRKQQEPPVAMDGVERGLKAFAGERAPGRQGGLDADAEEAQKGFLKDGGRDRERGVDDDRADEIGARW